MRKTALCALTALVVASVALVAAGLSGAAPAAELGVVAAVYDGDTLTLRDGRRVRLLQVDTPEFRSGECYSRAARAALLQLVPLGAQVRLEADAALDRTDRYGRLLRYIRRGGVNVNVELVRQGAAAPYFYGSVRGRYAPVLMQAAASAKASRRGLWGACPQTVLDPDRAVETGRSGPPADVPAAGRCDRNYAGGCVPPGPPDLDCDDIRALGIAPVRVVGADPHRLDGDGDGLGCE